MPHDDAAPLLLDFAADLSRVPRDLPPAVVAQATALLADHLVLVADADQPPADPASGDSLVERAASDAARGSIADRDDVHWGMLVHPGAIIWPTVLALGGRPDAAVVPGDLLRAAAIGYETMVRLAAWIRGAQTLGGTASDLASFHLTALVGPAGAAAAASALLSADGSVNPDALGHALSVAGGSSGALLERTGTRSFHRANALRTGISAAVTAARGVDATRRDLERGGGALPAVPAAALPELSALLIAGEVRALAETSVRLFPTAGWFQAAYEAARSIEPTDAPITAVQVTVSPATAARSLPRAEAGADPWNSLETAVARGLAAAGHPKSEAELRDAVTVATFDGAEGATVEVHDGAPARSAAVVRPLGHPARPATIADLATTWGLSLAIAEGWLADLQRALETSTTVPRNPPGSVPSSSPPRRSMP